MVNYTIISEWIINVLRVLLIRKMMELFLSAEDGEEKKIRVGFFLYYLLTLVLFFHFHISVPYETGNYLGILGLTFLYSRSVPLDRRSILQSIFRSPDRRGTWKKRIWVSLVVFSMDMACSLAGYFALGQKGMLYHQAIQTLLLLLCTALISRMTYPADSREMVFDGRQTSVLIVIPAVSIFILGILFCGKSGDMASLLICLSMLLINLSVFWLYHIMAENYKKVRDNDIYRQQTFAYKNQLEVIMESRNRIRALRHDMKNHMLALQVLLQKKDWEGADRYLDSMQEFMANPAEHVITGNDAVDSLLNYKLERANEVLHTVEARISIPETLMLHSFDLNVVLANLLDNAIEAALQTEEKWMKIAMKLEKGILSVNIRNSCQGIADGKVQHLETTKEDPRNHGTGLSNVRRIVEKYHGDMELICEDGKLEVDIIMYIREM